MTKGPNVYRPSGESADVAGHRHPTVQQAGQCLEHYRRQGSPTGLWSPSPSTLLGRRPRAGTWMTQNWSNCTATAGELTARDRPAALPARAAAFEPTATRGSVRVWRLARSSTAPVRRGDSRLTVRARPVE